MQAQSLNDPTLTKEEIFNRSEVNYRLSFESSVWPKLEALRVRDGAIGMQERVMMGAI